MKKMRVEINEDAIKIDDISIFGVRDLKIGENYILIKKDDDNLVHFIDYKEVPNPYFTVIRIKDGERLAHNYKYSNFELIEIMEGYHNKTL